MNEKAISLEAIIWAAKEIAHENQVNAAYLMGYAQGLMDQEQTRRVCDAASASKAGRMEHAQAIRRRACEEMEKEGAFLPGERNAKEHE